MRILHLFKWRINDIINELDNIKEQGFNAIQISPIQPSKDNSLDSPWWMDYQPIAFKIGNKYGSKEDLINLCYSANNIGISIIVDVVCNHVASCDSGEIIPHDLVDNSLKNNKDFWKSYNKILDWENRYEVINYSMGLPSLNLSNHDLQDIIISFLNELINCGVRGFRFDAAKNIALPSEGNDFWIRVLNSLNFKDDLFNYCEVIFSSKELIDEYSKYLNVLTDCFSSNIEKTVSYVDSHDLQLEFNVTSSLNDDIIIEQYKNLTKHYPHTLWYARPYNDTWKRSIIKNIHNKNIFI